MRTAVSLGVALLWTVSVGAQGAGQAAGTAKPQSTSSVATAIQQVADAYVKAALAGDAKAIAALYAEDAVEMPPNEPVVKGRAAIEQYYTKVFSGARILKFTLTHLETQAAGDTGYDVGTYQQSANPPGQTVATSDSGKFVVILKRSQGAWKIGYAIYNSDQAPQQR